MWLPLNFAEKKGDTKVTQGFLADCVKGNIQHLEMRWLSG